MNEAGYSPVAVYNATDTFLFLPSASDGERRILVDHAFDQVMALQRESRRTNALVAQSGRYSERIKQETIAEVKKRLGDEEAQREALADALAQARLEATVFDQLILDHERQLAAAAQELEDARAFAAAVLAQEQRQLEDAAASAKAARDQNTQLREQLSTARHESIRRRDELAELHRRIVDEREASRIELHELTQLQRRTLGEREAALAELKVLRVNVQASLKAAQQRHNDVSAKLVNAEGMVARKTRELERTQRDLLNRRRQVTATDLKIATIVNTSQATADEVALVRNSLSFKLGSLTIESLKSPRRAFALLWTVPKLLLGERRRRAANGGGQR
jgi:chromosome segregation ATPase